MIQADVDKAGNLLRVTYSGRVGPQETRPAVERLKSLLADVAPGFRLLTDLSGLEEMDVGCVADMRQMMDLCDEKGVETIVRVIPDPHKDIGFNLLSLFHYGREVRLITCETRAEAIEALNGLGGSVEVERGGGPEGAQEKRRS